MLGGSLQGIDMVHCHWHGLGDEYVHTNPLMIGTQIAKITVLQINDHRGFSISHKQMSYPGCANAREGMSDCGQGGAAAAAGMWSAFAANFAQFNRIVGAACRRNAAIGAEY
jgi:hypothetical protein